MLHDHLVQSSSFEKRARKRERKMGRKAAKFSSSRRREFRSRLKNTNLLDRRRRRRFVIGRSQRSIDRSITEIFTPFYVRCYLVSIRSHVKQPTSAVISFVLRSRDKDRWIFVLKVRWFCFTRLEGYRDGFISEPGMNFPSNDRKIRTFHCLFHTLDVPLISNIWHFRFFIESWSSDCFQNRKARDLYSTAFSRNKDEIPSWRNLRVSRKRRTRVEFSSRLIFIFQAIRSVPFQRSERFPPVASYFLLFRFSPANDGAF